ncbi:hypothetical protein FRC03_002175 [Tulasnella sp. 419]|nr:hypothetical protein FRC03_002175 [Tulasnella sp. 419]
MTCLSPNTRYSPIIRQCRRVSTAKIGPYRKFCKAPNLRNRNHPSAHSEGSGSASINNTNDTATNNSNEPRLDWEERFGCTINKDHSIWEKYVQEARNYDKEVIDAMSYGMDVLLVFSGLFSAVVTTFIVQAEQDLLGWDPAEHTALVTTLIFRQLDILIKHLMGPSTRLPVLDPSSGENKYLATFTVFAWYISLDLSLLVAGGAVCMKLWLLEYRRANSSRSMAYYDRAMRHQETLAGLKRWFIPEFGNLLGCIVLLNLIPFFSGLTHHSGPWRTGNAMFWDVSYAMLGVYTAFLVCTLIIGVLVPTCAYKTPMSNLLSHLAETARGIPSLISTKPLDIIWYTGIMVIVFVAIVIPVSVDQRRDWWLITLWTVPMVLTIGFGLRNGLKIGRVAIFVPAMGLLIGILAMGSMALTFFPKHFSLDDYPALYYLTPTILLFIFGFVSIGLSHRFSPPRSHRNLPVVGLLLSASAIMLSAWVSCNFSPAASVWSFPTIRVALWGSMVVLSLGSLLKEGDVEEDTRESEALGWMIEQTSDTGALHSALACIPGIANTPLRRQIMFRYVRRTLTSRINSLVDSPERRSLNGGSCWSGDAHPERRENLSCLAFYVTCLAEVAHAASSHPPKIPKQNWWWSPLASYAGLYWFGNNWYHFLTIPPSTDTLRRELRFIHHWNPWFRKSPSDLLRLNLETLAGDPDTYLRVVCRAALSQLYPSSLPVDDISAWPSFRTIYTSQSNFHSCHGKLVAIRMVTIRVVTEFHRSKTLEPSFLRYLFHYCDTAMKSWPFGRTTEDTKAFEVLMTLAYLVLENDSSIITVTLSSDTIPLKVARCIMALKRWYDKNESERTPESPIDSRLHSSFALSLLGVVDRYLRLAAKDLGHGDRNLQWDERTDLEEHSLSAGMKCLEQALLELAGRAWSDGDGVILDRITSSWAALITISKNTNIELQPIGNRKAAILLVKQLKSQALDSDRLVLDRVSAIDAITKTINNLLDSTIAEIHIIQDEPSLDMVIRRLFEEDCVDIRIAALAALLNIHLLHPPTPNSHRECFISEPGPVSSLTTTQEVVIDFGTIQGIPDLEPLYNLILSDTRPFACESDNLSQQILIGRIIAVASKLPHTSLPSTFFNSETGPKASSMARIASQEDRTVIHASTRISALRLFGWILDYEIDQKGEVEALKPEGIVTGLGEIAKGINLLTDDHVRIPLDDLSGWLERLTKICTFSHVAQVVSESELIEALCDAVGWADFRKLEEQDGERRERVFAQLMELRGKIIALSSRSQE